MRSLIKVIPTIFLGCFTINGNAQTFDWAKRAGSWAFDYGYGVSTDAAGNVYMAGKYEMDAYFDAISVTCKGNHDIYIAKYNSSGNIQWVRTAGGQWGDYAHAITSDAAGNVYVTGEIEMTCDFGSKQISSWGANDGFLAKYSTNGDFLWGERFGGSESDQGHAVAVSGDAVYVAGKFRDTAYFGKSPIVKLITHGTEDIFVAKYDLSGNFKWVRYAGSMEDDEALGVAADNTGNVYVTGYYSNNADFSGSVLTSSGKDIFLAKYSSDGTFQWVKRAGGSANDYGCDVEADASGMVYLTGRFRMDADFGELTLKGNNGNSDIFIAQYNSNGDAIWAKKAGGKLNDSSRGIALSNNTLFITGAFGDNASFGNTTLTAADSSDIFVASYSTLGDFNWAIAAGGVVDTGVIGGTEESGLAIAADNFGHVFVSGNYYVNAVFEDVTLTGWSHTDAFLSRVSSGTNTGLLSHSKGAEMLIYPNPAHSQLILKWNLPGYKGKKAAVEITDILGRVIYTEEWQINGETDKREIDVKHFRSGVYLYKATYGSEQLNAGKVIIN